MPNTPQSSSKAGQSSSKAGRSSSKVEKLSLLGRDRVPENFHVSTIPRNPASHKKRYVSTSNPKLAMVYVKGTAIEDQMHLTWVIVPGREEKYILNKCEESDPTHATIWAAIHAIEHPWLAERFKTVCFLSDDDDFVTCFPKLWDF